MLERAVFFAGSETILREDLALQFSSRDDGPASDEIVSLVEAEARDIRRVLMLEQGSVERARRPAQHAV